jgi:hypothetical protein
MQSPPEPSVELGCVRFADFPDRDLTARKV